MTTTRTLVLARSDGREITVALTGDVGDGRLPGAIVGVARRMGLHCLDDGSGAPPKEHPDLAYGAIVGIFFTSALVAMVMLLLLTEGSPISTSGIAVVAVLMSLACGLACWLVVRAERAARRSKSVREELSRMRGRRASATA